MISGTFFGVCCSWMLLEKLENVWCLESCHLEWSIEQKRSQ